MKFPTKHPIKMRNPEKVPRLPPNLSNAELLSWTETPFIILTIKIELHTPNIKMTWTTSRIVVFTLRWKKSIENGKIPNTLTSRKTGLKVLKIVTAFDGVMIATADEFN